MALIFVTSVDLKRFGFNLTQGKAEMQQELIRLSRLVEDLGILARVDSQRLAIGEEQVDAKRLATPNNSNKNRKRAPQKKALKQI